MSPLLAILLWFQAVGGTVPAQPDSLFHRANQYYIHDDYESAVKVYEQIIAGGHENSAVYFNLGNAYYKLKKTAQAILNYERARRLAPNDPDLLANLQLAQLMVADKITPIPPMIHERIWAALLRSADVQTWRNWFLLGLQATALLLCLRVLVRRWWRGMRAVLTAVSLATVLMLACTLSASAARHTSSEAVIMVEKVEVRGSPADDAVELFALHEGSVVKIRRRSGSWLEIELADGKIGWAPDDALEII